MGKNLLLWLVIAAVLLTVFNNFDMRPEPAQVSYSEFIEQVRMDEVREVVIEGLVITGITKSGDEFRAIRPDVEDPKLLDGPLQSTVSVLPARSRKNRASWAQLFLASFPILLIIGVFMLFMRQMQGGRRPGAAGRCRSARARRGCSPRTRSRPRSPMWRA